MQEIRGRDCPFKNASGEKIPPGALLVPGDTIEDTGAVRVTKPTAANMPGLLVNGPFTVDIDGEGVGTFGPAVELGYDPAGLTAGVPAAGTYGSQAGSWYAKAGNTGFVAFGTASADYGLMNAVRDGSAGGGGGGGVSGSPCGVGPAWLGAIETYHCLTLTVIQAVGKCDCVDTAQVFYLTYDALLSLWTVDEAAYPADYQLQLCGVLAGYRIRFRPNPCGPPCVTLVATEAVSGVYPTYNLQFACGGDQYVTFSGGGPSLCDGDEVPGGPMNNRFMIRIDWGCDTVIPCCTQPIPHTLHVTFGASPDCDCAVAGQTFALNHVPGTGVWEYQQATCSADYNGNIGPGAVVGPAFVIQLSCGGAGSWALSLEWRGHKLNWDGFGNLCNYLSQGFYNVIAMPDGDCDPFLVEFGAPTTEPPDAICGATGTPLVIPKPCATGMPTSATVTL